MVHLNNKEAGLQVDDLLKNLNTKIVCSQIHVYDCVSSTMDITREAIADNAPDGYTVFAEQQTGGKGRRGRVWMCPRNKGLLFTIVLKPQITLDYICFLMGFASVAIAEAIKHLFQINVSVKWPNDIIINNKKTAGILVEAHGAHNQQLVFTIGVGINVNISKDELPVGTPVPATSLAIETNQYVDRIQLARTILQSIDNWYDYLKEGKYDFIRETWLGFCLRYNNKLHITENNNKYSGKLIDISEKGDLITLGLGNNKLQTFKSEFITL